MVQFIIIVVFIICLIIAAPVILGLLAYVFSEPIFVLIFIVGMLWGALKFYADRSKNDIGGSITKDKGKTRTDTTGWKL